MNTNEIHIDYWTEADIACVRESTQCTLDEQDRATRRFRGWQRREWERRNLGVQVVQNIGNLGNG